MKNVYDQVNSFYDQEEGWYTPVSRDWVEGFLRYKAWQGLTDRELRTVWRQLELLILYLIYISNEDLNDMQAEDYSMAVEWLDRHVTGFTANARSTRRFFSTLRQFYEYLESRKVIIAVTPLEEAERSLRDNRRSLKPCSYNPGMENRLSAAELVRLLRDSSGELDADLGKMIGETAEHLMTQLGVFFQQERFAEDLRRALFLYNGPVDMLAEDENKNDDEEFWLGFWDYFLFDYHLLSCDQTPLAYFDEECGKSLTAEERLLLNQLLAARFTIFYVKRITGHEWVECVNLFTEETFQLPMPDFSYKILKNSLFYGHIFSQDIVMVNYVTCIEVSSILRRRIQEQVAKQKKIYEIQRPECTWDEFFGRHSLAVRHAIDRLLNLATVNVTPFSLLEKQYPKVAVRRLPDAEVMDRIATIMKKYNFSLHDITLAHSMWNDYYQSTSAKIRRPEIWAAAVVFSYAQLNYPHGFAASQLAADLKVSGSSIYHSRKKLSEVLRLTAFDPRYLSEEGLVCALFLS
jgi:hypothetical protein